jgi:hypothetical protein
MEFKGQRTLEVRNMENVRDKLFISYSHKNENWLEKFTTMLGGLSRWLRSVYM